MTRRSERIQQAIRESERQYRKEVLQRLEVQVPQEYHGFTLEDNLYRGGWEGRLGRGAVSKIKKYVRNPSRFLVLKGMKGLGKSTMAYTVSRDILVRHNLESVHYRSMPTLFDEFSFRDHDDVSPVKRCSEVDLLIIDDIGAAGEQATPHQKRCLWSVIDTRWGEGKLTILTTNMSITSTTEGQGLADWFGNSAWDRIQDDMVLVEFKGSSFRERSAI